MDDLTTQLSTQLTNLSSNLFSSNLVDLSNNLSNNLVDLSSNIVDLSANLTELSSSLFTSTLFENLPDLTGVTDYLYTNFVDNKTPVRSGRTVARKKKEEPSEPADDNFMAILADSDVLNVLQATTKRHITDVDRYGSELCRLINDLAKNQPDHFDVMLEVISQKITEQITWAKACVQFEHLKNDDRVLLLKNSWSSNLLLDSMYQRCFHKLPDQMGLTSGGQFSLLTLALFGNDDLLAERQLEDLEEKLIKLKFDYVDYVCTKFLLLLDLDLTRMDETCELKQHRQVRESYEQIVQVFGDYTTENYCHLPDKFGRLLREIIPEIKSMALQRLEKHLVRMYTNGHSIPALILELLDGKNNLDRITRVRRPF